MHLPDEMPSVDVALTLSYIYFIQSIHCYPMKRRALQSDVIDAVCLIFSTVQTNSNNISVSTELIQDCAHAHHPPVKLLVFNPKFPFIS